jgi:hypothetical protein
MKRVTSTRGDAGVNNKFSDYISPSCGCRTTKSRSDNISASDRAVDAAFLGAVGVPKDGFYMARRLKAIY